ncbi:aminoglycoside phosphotransferase family protein [Candidatus Woesebacteria bacterium]|nr:aminoglycoside phosphotransferase family protein [Candidatus Woesebacteria bacterium]
MKKTLFDLSDRTNMFYWQTNRNISPQENKQLFLTRRKDFSKTLVKQAIAYGMQQYGLSEKDAQVVEMSGPIQLGNINNVVKATLQNGLEVIARVHPPQVKNGYFWVEKTAAANARKKGAASFSTYYIDDTRKRFAFDFMLLECLPGTAIKHMLPLEPAIITTLMKDLGAQCAKFHNVHPTDFGFMRNDIAKTKGELVGQYPTMRDHFYAALDDDLRFLVSEGLFSQKQEDAIRKICKNNEQLLQLQTSSLVHNDVADWNVLSDGTRITGIVDWDECCAGDPVMDFAQFSLFYDDTRMKPFIEGYRTISALPTHFDEKLALYRLRYLISKLHLRFKRSKVDSAPFLQTLIKHGMTVLEEVFHYYNI